MIHYKCAACKAVLETDSSERGKEQACPHCGTINIVPGGTKKKRRFRRQAWQRSHEEQRRPLTAGTVLKTIGLALAAIGATGALGFVIWYQSRPAPGLEMVKPFELYVDEYCEIEGLQDAPPRTPVPTPYIVGKLVVVNRMAEEDANLYMNSHEADLPNVALDEASGEWRGMNWKEFGHLPDDLRAETPEEVETVVWLQWQIREILFHQDEPPGRRILCDITVIDKDKALIVGRASVKGGRAPLPVPGASHTIGSRPTKDILDYVSAIPCYNRDHWGAMTRRGGRR